MENLRSANKPKVSDQLLAMARKEPDAVLKELESQANGLSMAEAEARVKREEGGTRSRAGSVNCR